MEPHDNGSEPAGGSIMVVHREFGHSAKSNRRKKEKREPGETTDITGFAAYDEPGDPSHGEDDTSGNSPGGMTSMGPPAASKHRNRRHQGQKEKDVIKIHYVPRTES